MTYWKSQAKIFICKNALLLFINVSPFSNNVALSQEPTVQNHQLEYDQRQHAFNDNKEVVLHQQRAAFDMSLLNHQIQLHNYYQQLTARAAQSQLSPPLHINLVDSNEHNTIYDNAHPAMPPLPPPPPLLAEPYANGSSQSSKVSIALSWSVVISDSFLFLHWTCCCEYFVPLLQPLCLAGKAM